MNASIIKTAAVKDLQIVETALLLAGSVLFQFIIHLIPVSGTPLGAVLMAVFYAPLIAAVFFKSHVAFMVGLLAPIINYLITGSPAPEMLTLITVELAVFISLLYLFFNFKMIKKISALPAILISMIVSPFIVSLFGANYHSNIFQSVLTALPGIILLSLLNYFLLRYKEKD